MKKARLLFIAPILAFASTPALAIDSCLVGKWRADDADTAHVIGASSGANVQHVSGETIIDIDQYGNLTILANDVRYRMTTRGIAPFYTTMSGSGSGAMNADDGRNFVVNLPEFNFVMRSQILGETLEIPVQAGQPGTTPGRAEGRYGCTASSASFDVEGEFPVMPRRWIKIR